MKFIIPFLLAPILKTEPYLDPGSGSFILQILIAALAGGALALKLYWKKLIALFNRKPLDEINPESSDQEEHDQE